MFVLRVVGLVVGLLSYASPVTTFAETDRCQPPPSSNDPREYRDRGDRCEGTSPKPVSVQDGIDLLSALIDYQDEPERIGDHFRVQFFLPPKSTKVSLVVKERDNHFFYRLDKVSRPPWTNGSYNVFAWRTADVIRRIDALRMRDLGVVVRFVDNAGDESVDQVAPAVFYQSRPLANSRIRGYVFSFRVGGYAALTGTANRRNARCSSS